MTIFLTTQEQASEVFDMLCVKVPPEITIIILDYAPYWPMERWCNNEYNRVSGRWYDEIHHGVSKMVHLSTKKGGKTIPKRIKKIRICSVAHDQGWGGDNHSWTWGEIRFHLKDGSVNAHEFYRNISRYNVKQDHEKIYDTEMVEAIGNIANIDVIHYAAYPGWQNNVYSTAIEIFYSLDFPLGD